MRPFEPATRHICVLRSPDGRIRSLRVPWDPVFDLLDWLDDPEVRAFFAAKDRARRLALGATEEDERDLAELERWRRMRLLARLAAQRGRR